MRELDTPVTETDRLILRGWRDTDATALAASYRDEDHARFVGGRMERWQVWRTMAMYVGHHVLRGYTLFAVEEKTSGDLLGWAGPWYPEGWPEREIGYGLVPAATGKGFAKEAAVAALRYAYERLDWRTAVSNIDAANEGSQHVAAAMGAVPERETEILDGETVTLWRHLPPAQFMERFA